MEQKIWIQKCRKIYTVTGYRNVPDGHPADNMPTSTYSTQTKTLQSCKQGYNFQHTCAHRKIQGIGMLKQNVIFIA